MTELRKPAPEGEEWVLVPLRPTKQMLEAMKKTMPRLVDKRLWVSADVKHLRRWNAALSCIPIPPANIKIVQPGKNRSNARYGSRPMRPDYCEADADDLSFPIGPHRPCICGATVDGKDRVRGICQAKHNGPKPEPLVRLVVVHRDTGFLA